MKTKVLITAMVFAMVWGCSEYDAMEPEVKDELIATNEVAATPMPLSTYINLAPSASLSAESTYPGYSVTKINDGSRNTTVGGAYSWANNHPAGGRLPESVTLTFPAAKLVNRLDIYTSTGYVLKDYTVQYKASSSGSWLTLFSVDGNTSVYRRHNFSYTNVYAVKIICERGPDNQYIYGRLNEVEIYGYPSLPVNLSPYASLSAESTYPGYSVARIKDGSRNTTVGGAYSWANNHPAGGRLPESVTMTFDEPMLTERIDIYTSTGYVLKDYTIQYKSSASGAWQTLLTVDNNTNVYRYHLFSRRNMYAVKIICERGPDNQYIYGRLNEVEVYGYL